MLSISSLSSEVMFPCMDSCNDSDNVTHVCEPNTLRSVISSICSESSGMVMKFYETTKKIIDQKTKIIVEFDLHMHGQKLRLSTIGI